MSRTTTKAFFERGVGEPEKGYISGQDALDAVDGIYDDVVLASNNLSDVASADSAVSNLGARPATKAPPSGIYFGRGGNATTQVASLNGLNATPIHIKSGTLTRIGVEVTSAGSAGSVVRLGIYGPSATTQYPGSLILDAGTIDGTSATYQEITISQAVSGWVWLVSATQVATCTLRAVTGSASGDLLVGYSSATNATANSAVGYLAAGVSGALPSTFPAGADGTAALPKVVVKG